MSRISTPATLEAAPAAAQPLLSGVKASLGVVPAMFRLTSTSPAALEGLLSLSGALGKGALSAKTREALALTVANVNGCNYCNSAHGYIAANLLKVDAPEIDRQREARSADPKLEAALRFARAVALNRGAVDEAEFAAVRAAGYTDAELIEIVGAVALNTYTNYINEVFKTDVDFPVAEARRAA